MKPLQRRNNNSSISNRNLNTSNPCHSTAITTSITDTDTVMGIITRSGNHSWKSCSTNLAIEVAAACRPVLT